MQISVSTNHCHFPPYLDFFRFAADNLQVSRPNILHLIILNFINLAVADSHQIS